MSQPIPSRSPAPIGRLAAASLIYAAPVLASAWILAGVRNFFLVAGADPLLAALGEAPAVALVMVYAAGWSVRSFGIAPALGQRLTMGLLAAGLMATVAILLRGVETDWRWGALGAPLATGPGGVFVFSLLLAIVAPALRERAVTLA